MHCHAVNDYTGVIECWTHEMRHRRVCCSPAVSYDGAGVLVVCASRLSVTSLKHACVTRMRDTHALPCPDGCHQIRWGDRGPQRSHWLKVHASCADQDFRMLTFFEDAFHLASSMSSGSGKTEANDIMFNRSSYCERVMRSFQSSLPCRNRGSEQNLFKSFVDSSSLLSERAWFHHAEHTIRALVLSILRLRFDYTTGPRKDHLRQKGVRQRSC